MTTPNHIKIESPGGRRHPRVCDVMEHIPTEYVMLVLERIRATASKGITVMGAPLARGGAVATSRE